MSHSIVTVTAHLSARKDMKENVKAELLKLISPTRSEPGCIAYDLYQSAENNSLFMFYECWKSKKDLDEHLHKPYIRAFMERAGAMLAEPVKVSLWEMISKR